MTQRWARVVGALNGAVGDYLVRSDNPLATRATLARRGARLGHEPAELASAYPEASGTLVVLLHGLMGSELDFVFDDGRDYGALLEADLGASALYVRYNSGQRLAESAREVEALLAAVVSGWPVTPARLILIGHSMGGLVAREACRLAREAGHSWLGLAREAVYLGTPHRGSPLERAVALASELLRAVPDPTTRLVAQVASARSEGIRDLGRPELSEALDHQLRHLLVASSLTRTPLVSDWLGDVLVPVPSALDGAHAELRPEHVELKVLEGLSHLELAHSPVVYETIKTFVTEARA